MKKHAVLSIGIMCFCLGISSCTSAPKTEVTHLKDSVFTVGSLQSETESCKVEQRCDCCTSTLLFISDRQFYSLSRCESDEILRKGEYLVKNDTVTLTYHALCRKKEYNWENEVNEEAVDFFYSETTGSTTPQQYLIGECDGNFALLAIDGNNLGVLDNNSAHSFYSNEIDPELHFTSSNLN